ncbi:hypothetical protein SAMN04489735_100231 [Aneurinibacillus thermoaerophilus]|uniref:Uncharacterized protein n=1 Tax=Aneurinibacillus thermoaerophilus TaxID=143495 RepID=A0A1G7WNU7_ANETH|nr:hypothetical protein [Aneurinibacillus thermoaerophilus]SDG73573.1 hypothetical protein SAMN04489735_100231 [Aneurinibacillus thermoaerophilus]
MVQVKNEMFNRMMEELKQQKELVIYKTFVLQYINNAIENLNIQGTALELLKGSMISIHTAKTREEVDFYTLHAEDFIRNIENNKQ